MGEADKEGVHTSQLRTETESGRKARVHVRQRKTDGARKKTKRMSALKNRTVYTRTPKVMIREH